MSQQLLYRRSLRHMTLDTLKQLMSAELKELNDVIVSSSEQIASAASSPLTPEQVTSCMELISPACPSVLLINEILDTIKQISKDSEDDLCMEVSDTDLVRQEIFRTFTDYKTTVQASVIESFNKMHSNTTNLFLECKRMLESKPSWIDDDKWMADLANAEKQAVECYEQVKRWSDGKTPHEVRSAMDRISQDVKTLTTKLGQNPINRSDGDCESIASRASSASNLAARAAVQRAKERVRSMKATNLADQPTTNKVRNTTAQEISLLTATGSEAQSQVESGHHSGENMNSGNVVTTIAKAIADSMALTRVPTAKPFVFSGDPLKFSDWEINFSAAFDRNGISDAEKMSHLQSFVGGKAKQAIARFFRQSTSKALIEARALLKKRFGNDMAISDAYRTELQNWPKIGGKDTEALTDFSDFLQQCLSAMTDIQDLESLNDRSENKKMVDKLPDWLANRWKRKVNAYKSEHQRYPKLHIFAEFISQEADIACEEVTTELRQKPATKPHQFHKQTAKRTAVFKTETTEAAQTQPTGGNKYCQYCEMSNHNTVDCGLLARKPYAEALQIVKDKRLCFRCLRSGHSFKYCQERVTCKKCPKRHPTCLHQETAPSNTSKTTATKAKSETERKADSATCGKVMSASNSEVFTSSMIVPVWVSHKANPDREVLVYALLDTQSNASFIQEQTCDTLKCPTVSTQLQLTTMTTANTSIDCNKVQNLLVRGLRENSLVELPTCYTRQDIPIDRDHIPTPKKIRDWPHLKELRNEMSELLDCEVGLLIGYNCPEALAPIETIVEKGNQPFGVKTSLGWSVVGSLDLRESADAVGVSHRIVTKEAKVGSEVKSVRFQTKLLPKESVKREMHNVLNLLELDFKDTNSDQQMSQDDIKFLNMLENGVRQESDGHLSMPLPLKDRPKFPDSRPMAEKRLKLLRRKLDTDPEYKKQYRSFMNDLLAKGHAEKVSEENKNGEVWYIPHFGVYHPKKPGKLRVVFDCAARFQEYCLNDHLLKGPDQMNTLIGVLLRFRLRPIAVMCDVEGMFHQFKVHKEDRDYLRFLWLDEDLNTAEYRMTVHLFGATSSPGCATFGLRNLADRYSSTFPEAAKFIENSSKWA